MPAKITKGRIHLDEDAYTFLGRPPGVTVFYSSWDLYLSFFPGRTVKHRFVKRANDWTLSRAGLQLFIKTGNFSVERNTDLLYPCLIIRNCLTTHVVDCLKIPRGENDDSRN